MKKNVVLSIVGVLLVLGIGISFAYYVSQVLVTGDGSDVSVTPGDMIKVTYDAGDGIINSEGMVPGDIATKEFSVTVTPTEQEREATYSIILNITENTFIKCDDSNYNSLTNACQQDAEELVYRLKDSDNQVIAEGSLMGVTGEIKLITETKNVDVQTIYNYTLEIEFIETGYDQNHNQNKVFNGSVEVEFDEVISAKDYILADKTIDSSRNGAITGVLTEDTTGTVYSVADDDGTSYVYAGAPTDNCVRFANYWWRIIRINGDGTIRMIYQGTNATATGTNAQIQTSSFNSSYNDNAYVGYMYGSTGANSYSETHANTNPSTILMALNTWYQNNLSSYASYIDTDAGFCGDRRVATSSETFWSGDTKRGYETNTTAYAPFSRFLTTSNSWASTQIPTLKCSQLNDLYTVSSSNQGNRSLTYPIGLITADEVVLAGGFAGTNNTSYYLYTGQDYWTMSPSNFYSFYANVFGVNTNGNLIVWSGHFTYGVRPVINLKADVQLSGSGTSDDPYVVVGAE